MLVKLLEFSEVIDCLKKGGVVVFPTDTLFGLLANAFDEKAVSYIYKVKKRDEKKPLLLLTDSFDKVKEFLKVEKWHNFFIEEWPAPLTLIFEVKDEYKENLNYLHRGTNKIAVRIPNDELLLKLLSNLDFPLVAPSANPQSLEPASTIKKAIEYFGNEVCYYKTDVVLKGEPSTLVDLSSFPPKILREGRFKTNFFFFSFKGHKNIRATHKYTFEITKEDFVTEKGDCIIGIKGFSNKEFQEKTKKLPRFSKISYFIFSSNYYDRGFGYLEKPKEPSEVSFVARRSKFIDERTGLIKSNKTAQTLNRKLINELKQEKKAYIIFKEVKNRNLLIDFRSLLKNDFVNLLPERLKKRIDLEKNEDFFDKDLLYILKKEKFIQNLDLIRIEVQNYIEKNREVFINKINKIIDFSKQFPFSEVNRIVILNRSQFFDFNLNSFGFDVVDLREKNLKELLIKFANKSILFSNNDYLLKNAKKLGITTFSEKDKYFVDFVVEFNEK